MIVVTGSSRTGTSMLMQTLVNLGYTTVAKKFSKEHKKVIKYNRNGYYELTREEIKRLSKKDSGKAVKIFGNCLPLVNSDHISKMIVMTRNKEDAIRSTIPVFEKLGYNSDAEESYNINYKIISLYLKTNSTIILNFEKIVENPKREILKVVELLGIKFDKLKFDKAVNNIKFYNHGISGSSSSNSSNRSRATDSWWNQKEKGKKSTT